VCTITNDTANFTKIHNFNENCLSLGMIMYLTNALPEEVQCWGLLYMIHVDEQKSPLNCTPPVQKCTKIFFSNLLNLILARKYNFPRVYNCDICFSLLLNFHSDVQSLYWGCTHPVQVCTITSDTASFTNIYIINFIKIGCQAIIMLKNTLTEGVQCWGLL